MAVVSTTFLGVNVFQFSGAVTDAEIKTAWASLITNGTYILNRAIYLDATVDLTAVTGGFMVDFGTQVSPAFILHNNRDKTKSTFNNFIFIQRTGLSVPTRGTFVNTTNGTSLANAGSGLSTDGVSQNGGAFVYAVPGNPGGADPRYLNEMAWAGTEGVTIMSQEFTEQELQICAGASTAIKGMKYEKAYGFPQVGTPSGNVNVTVYRSTQNTQSLEAGGLIPIRLFPTSNRYASACYVDSYVTRNGADINTRLVNAFGSNASNPACFVVLNNYTRESWFGASKTVIPITTWSSANFVYGGVLKKLQFVNGNGGVVKAYDSRSTTVAQKCKFAETGFFDFTDTNLAPTTDATGKITLVHIGAIASGATAAIARYTGQKYTFQKFGYRVLVGTPDMTSGDNDLSAFTPITLTAQTGISRTQAAINAATTIDTFQQLLEELHVLAIGLSGSQSYNGVYDGNLFSYDGSTLTTSFTTVNVDATAASKIAYNSATNTLTIKSSILMDSAAVQRWNNSIGAINLLNGAQIQGVYQTSSGTSTIWEFGNISEPVLAGTSLAIYDNAGNTKYFNAVTTNGVYRYYIAPQAVGETYTYAIEKYGTKRESGTFPSNAGGLLFYVPGYGEDVGITETNQATVAAYTILSDTAQMYDATAYFRLSETGIKLGQLVARDGLFLDFGTNNVKIKDDATSIVDYASGTITYKALVINASTKYDAMKATPPATITPTDNELINVVIEDANGDSQVTILGGDNLGYELWKVTTSTPTDDYATGTLLITLPTNDTPYRFIGILGFDIVGRDVSSGVRRRSSMAKGVYTQAFYVGDQIQLATNAPQLIENNERLSELTVEIQSIKGSGWETTNDSLKAISDSIGDPLQAVDYVEPDNATILAIDTKVQTLENYNDSTVQSKLDSIATDLDSVALESTAQAIKAKTDTLVNYNDATAQAKLDAIKAKTDTLVNTDLTGIALEATSQAIKTKVDSLNNTDLTGIALEATSQEILTAIGDSDVSADLVIINENVKDASLFIPATRNL